MPPSFWKKLNRPIMTIAPMSGVTDEPFRLMFLKYGKPDFFWTEFVSAEGLFSKGEKYCFKILDFDKSERPIIAQIFGADPVWFEKAAKMIAGMGFDGIDINMGCPDTNIEKKGGGAILIKNPALAKEIIRATKGAGKLPVSVKTRIGYDKNEIKKWIPALLKEEIAALTIHFRTRDEMYFPSAHWELANEIVKMRDKYSPKTLVLGNGDVKSLEQAKQLVKQTGLDGVVIGRNVLGNPWFFSKHTPTSLERLNAVVEHAEIFEKFQKKDMKKYGFCKPFDCMKKYFHAYAVGFNGVRELRGRLMEVKNGAQTKKVIKDFIKNL